MSPEFALLLRFLNYAAFFSAGAQNGQTVVHQRNIVRDTSSDVMNERFAFKASSCDSVNMTKVGTVSSLPKDSALYLARIDGRFIANAKVSVKAAWRSSFS